MCIYDSDGKCLTVGTRYPPDYDDEDDALFDRAYTYDSSGRLIHMVGGYDGANCRFAYDSNGKLSTITYGFSDTNPQAVYTYTYDSQGRKQRVSISKNHLGTNETYEYKYDSHGNMTSVVYTSSKGETSSVTYD